MLYAQYRPMALTATPVRMTALHNVETRPALTTANPHRATMNGIESRKYR
jgi:hypothetical protein